MSSKQIILVYQRLDRASHNVETLTFQRTQIKTNRQSFQHCFIGFCENVLELKRSTLRRGLIISLKKEIRLMTDFTRSDNSLWYLDQTIENRQNLSCLDLPRLITFRQLLESEQLVYKEDQLPIHFPISSIKLHNRGSPFL